MTALRELFLATSQDLRTWLVARTFWWRQLLFFAGLLLAVRLIIPDNTSLAIAGTVGTLLLNALVQGGYWWRWRTLQRDRRAFAFAYYDQERWYRLLPAALFLLLLIIFRNNLPFCLFMSFLIGHWLLRFAFYVPTVRLWFWGDRLVVQRNFRRLIVPMAFAVSTDLHEQRLQFDDGVQPMTYRGNLPIDRTRMQDIRRFIADNQ